MQMCKDGALANAQMSALFRTDNRRSMRMASKAQLIYEADGRHAVESTY